MTQVAPGPARDKLPVLKLLVEAWRLVFERIGDFAFLAAAPVLALCALSALRTIVTGDNPSALWLLGEQLMWTFVWASLGVSWHALVLLGGRNKRSWGELPFGNREGRFFLYALALRAPGVVVVLLMSRGDPERFAGLIFLCGVVQVLVAVMFPLVFPATAIDRDGGFLAAWRLLRSSALRLFVASMLAAMPLLALMLALAPIAALGAGSPAGVLFSPFEVIPSLAAEGIVAVVVALAYRRLTAQGGALAPAGGPD
jgi:hypothetical protein